MNWQEEKLIATTTDSPFGSNKSVLLDDYKFSTGYILDKK